MKVLLCSFEMRKYIKCYFKCKILIVLKLAFHTIEMFRLLFHINKHCMHFEGVGARDYGRGYVVETLPNLQ